MNNLYEIDRQLEQLIDPETGEVLDLDAFLGLQLEKERKLEDIALWIKNSEAEAAAIKTERDRLYKRECAAANNAKRLKTYLAYMLDGAKFSTARVACSYRKSTAVQTDEDFTAWAQAHGDQYLRYKDPEINKQSIKEAIENGIDVPHARIVENRNLIIK